MFPQHCLLPEFTPDEHASEVYDELVSSIKDMGKGSRSKILAKMAKALQKMSTQTGPNTLEGESTTQRVNPGVDSEGDASIQRVTAPQVTTSNNLTDPRTLRTKPRTHQRVTRANTPGMLPAINPVQLGTGTVCNDGICTQIGPNRNAEKGLRI